MPSEVPSDVVSFAGFVLMHCAAIADSNRDGELICPFAVVEDEATRHLVDFESETQEEAVAKGWASLDEWKERAQKWAFGREGLYRAGDTASDVLLVTAWAPGMTVPATVLQRFARDTSNGLYLVGEPELLVNHATGAEPTSDWNSNDLRQGIEAHPKGSRWVEWQSQ